MIPDHLIDTIITTMKQQGDIMQVPEQFKKYAYHGGAFDRGSADAYYYRARDPHKYEGGVPGKRIDILTEEELAAYNYAYDNETDRKVFD